MENKIYALIITILVAVSFCVTAFATGSESDIPTVEVEAIEHVPSEEQEEEPSELEKMEPSELESETGENVVVDLSPDSVNAIADALSNVSSITTAEGVSVSIPECVQAEWSNYIYRTCYLVNGTYCWILSNEFEVFGYGNDIQIDHFDGFYTYSGSPNYLSELPVYGWGQPFRLYRWTNYNVYDEEGVLVRAADATPEPRYFDVIFWVDGSKHSFSSIKEGTSITFPDVDVVGKTVVGWYYDANFENAYEPSRPLSDDLSLYAKVVEEPPMVSFHNAIFDSLAAFASAEPVFYIISIMCLAIIIAIIRRVVVARI